MIMNTEKLTVYPDMDYIGETPKKPGKFKYRLNSTNPLTFDFSRASFEFQVHCLRLPVLF